MKLTTGWDGTVERLQLARQLGVTHVKVNAADFLDESRRGPVIRERLLADKRRIDGHDLKIGVALLPQEPETQHWNVRLGGPEREREIKHVCESIRTLGGEGVPVVEYVFNLAGVFGSQSRPTGRGGSTVRHFDYEDAKRTPAEPAFAANEDEVWERIIYFLEHAVPVAENAGVKLACHPDDPPVPSVRGETRVLGTLDGLIRLIEAVPSEANGLNFCQGTVTEMGVDVIEAIRYFGSRGKIHHVHFRNVKGAVPRFDESFIDDGDVDMHAALRAYKEVGYAGTLMPDHWPVVAPGAPLLGWAFALGYMKAMMEELEVLEGQR